MQLTKKRPALIAAAAVLTTSVVANEAPKNIVFILVDDLGMPLKPGQHKDGISIKQAFQGSEMPFNRALYWKFPSRHGSGHPPSTAIREGKFKLIKWSRTIELYNIDDDMGEAKDLSSQLPEVHDRLKKKLISLTK